MRVHTAVSHLISPQPRRNCRSEERSHGEERRQGDDKTTEERSEERSHGEERRQGDEKTTEERSESRSDDSGIAYIV